MTHIQWDGTTFARVAEMWSKAPKTHAVGIDQAQITIRQQDSKPIRPESIERPSMGSFVWISENGALDWSPWAGT